MSYLSHTNRISRRVRESGFTLIEVLLVIAILAILAAIVIIAINPAKQLGEAQNTQRRSDVNTILNAVYQYSIDNSGEIPSTIPLGTSCFDDGEVICLADTICGGVNLDALVSGDKYLTDLPVDPSYASLSTTTDIGYAIMKNSNDRIEVCVTEAYNDEPISAKR